MAQVRELGTSLRDQSVEEAEQGASASVDWQGRPIEVNEYGLPVIWTYEPVEQRERPEAVQGIRKHAFSLFLIFAFGGAFLILLISKLLDHPDADNETRFLGMRVSKGWMDLFKYTTIPIVSVIFTWWHVWLGIKMCFYPVEFVGCLPPVLGWQGIVPRRAATMAERSCDLMIGKLLKIEEIIDRIDEKSFFVQLNPILVDTTTIVLEKLAMERAPGVWNRLPDTVKAELEKRIVEQAPMMFNPVINDVKENINKIVNVKEMAVQILVDNKPLMVEMFQEIGEREFTFIQHFSAVLGFICGLLQMMIWIIINAGHDESECHESGTKNSFHCWAGFLILPLSGLLIGYLTNYLGINLIFRPVWPHVVCGGYVNFQGVFLKRQQQVSEKMTKMICKNLVTARKMLEYVMKKDEIVNNVTEMFQKHIDTAIDNSISVAKPLMRPFVGKDAMSNLKCDVQKMILEELPKHTKEIEKYMDERFGLEETMSYRLAHLPPDQFEGMLHPVFQEDEWMVLLLGGVLGVAVGTLQAFGLGS